MFGGEARPRSGGPGERSKIWVGKDGRPRGGKPFARGGLYHLLSNPVYRGAVRHRDKLYADAHPAIIDEATWSAVQALLAANDTRKPATSKLGEGALLKGLLVDDLGNPMQPSHTCKAGRRYHYYITPARLTEWGAAGSLPRIGASVLDAFVVNQVQPVLHPNWEADGKLPARVRSALKSVRLGAEVITIVLRSDACRPRAGRDAETGDVELRVSITLKHRHNATLIAPADGPAPVAPMIDKTLVRALSVSRRWRRLLESGQVASTRDLAKREGLCHRHAGRLLPLAYLAPDLVEIVLEGRQPRALTLKALTDQPLPKGWNEQRRLFA